MSVTCVTYAVPQSVQPQLFFMHVIIAMRQHTVKRRKHLICDGGLCIAEGYNKEKDDAKSSSHDDDGYYECKDNKI